MDTAYTHSTERWLGYPQIYDEAAQTGLDSSPCLESSFHVTDPPLVKIATTDAEKRKIYAVRYTAYITEMNGEKRHPEADNTSQEFRDDWDDTAYHFYVERDGVLGACMRVNLRRDGPLECEEQLGIERFKPAFPGHVALTSRLVLRPDFRQRNLLGVLARAMYQFNMEQGIHYSFLDCHPKLLPLYTRLGYRLYTPGFNHKKYTYVIPMVLVMNDISHLDRVRSPLAPLARSFGSSSKPVAVRWDPPVQCTGDSTGISAQQGSANTGLFDSHDHVSDAELFEDLMPEEVTALVSLGHIISCRAGDSVLNPGDPGREIFVILNGSFQVQRRTIGASSVQVKVLKILSAGETFGEIRFLKDELRHASVKAREDSTLLILNAKALDRLVTTAPRIAAKVYRNIAKIVAVRLWDGVRFIRMPKAHAHKAVVNGCEL
jgi:hypothetical protein